MNKKLLAASMVLVVLSGVHVASAESRADATKEVLAASDAWCRAMIKQDGAALEKYLHPDLIYVHSNGIVQTKVEVIARKEVILALDFSDVTVHLYGKTALIWAKVEQKGDKHTAHLYVVHVWLKGPNGWQLVARQATRLGPPTPNISQK